MAARRTGASYPGPADRLAAYEAMIEAADGFERKGAANPYTSCNGHMSSFIDTDGSVGLRLSPDDRQAFIDQYGASLAEQHGKIMKEFVAVPAHLLDRPDELVAWFERGVAWVGTRKPKPTTR